MALEDFVTFQLLNNAPAGPVAPDDFTADIASKYAAQSPLGAFSPSVRAALEDLDRDRVARGAKMLGEAETRRLATAAQTRQLQTPAPRRNLVNVPGNALRDLRNIVTGIPMLPVAAARELADTARIPEHLANASSQGMNPVAAIATAPGVRMLPGSFVVGELAQGTAGLRNLAEHPLMTALDVLPGATKLAKGTTAARVAEESAAAAARAGQFTKPIRPLKAATMFRVVEDAATGQLTLERNMLGRTTDALGNTAVGQKMREVGGQAVRASMRTTSTWNAALMQTLVADAPIPQRLSAAREYVGVMREADQSWARWEKSHGSGWVADTTARMKLGDMADFTPEQHRFRQEYVSTLDRLRALEAAEAVGPMQLNGEWYDRATAGSIVRSEVKARRLEGNRSIRDAIAAAEAATPDAPYNPLDALARAREVAAAPLSTARGRGATERALSAYRGEVGKGRKMQEVRGWLHAAEAAGVDVSAIRAAMKPAADPADLLAAIDRTIANPTPFAGSPAMAASRRRKYVESLRVKDRTVDNARAAADKTLATEVPSRFVPKVREQMEARVADELATQAGRNLDPGELENAMRLYYEKRYADIGLDPRWVDQTSREIASTWQQMRDAGLDPVWVHDIPPSRVHAGMYPRVTELPNTPSQSRKQYLDPRPTTNDAFLALNQQGMEWVKRYASEQHITAQRQLFGKTRDQVYDMYRDRAMRMAGIADPRFQNAYIKELERLVSREWVPFNPVEQGYTWDSQALRNMAQEDILLPREIARNLKRLHDPEFGRGLAFLDPVMKVFRTSVLPLSPNWHMGNVIGNAISTAITNPRALGELGTAYKIFKDGQTGLIDEELLLRMGHEANELKTFSYHEGNAIHRLAAEAESSRIRAAASTISQNPAIQRASDVFGNVVNKSFDWNQRVDQFFRAANYLAEEKRLLKAGMDPSAARAGAIDLATKVLPDFASLTPIERQIFRYIFPFYSWTQHILRLTANLPIDHPSRVAVMSSLTRAELEDLPSGLAEEFLGALPVGGRLLKLGAWNPFGRVADSMTLLGFLSGVNPLLNVALEQAGVVGGKPNAYPELRYDPQTGRMQAIGPGMLSSFAYSLVPQLEPIANFAGLDSTYADLSVTDPGAAQRRVANAFGIPTPIAPKTIEQSVIANERAAFQAQSEAANYALRTGDFSRAKQFPGLAAWIATVQLMAERGDFQRGAEPPPIPGSAAAYNEDQQRAPTVASARSQAGRMAAGGL